MTSAVLTFLDNFPSTRLGMGLFFNVSRLSFRFEARNFDDKAAYKALLDSQYGAPNVEDIS